MVLVQGDTTAEESRRGTCGGVPHAVEVAVQVTEGPGLASGVAQVCATLDSAKRGVRWSSDTLETCEDITPATV